MLFLMASLASMSTAALADHVNHSLAGARRLVVDCRSDAPALRAMCLGYLAAISDGIARHQKIGSSSRTVCAPQDPDLEAYRRALLDYVAKTPDVMEGHSFEAVKAALEAQWPCQR